MAKELKTGESQKDVLRGPTTPDCFVGESDGSVVEHLQSNGTGGRSNIAESSLSGAAWCLLKGLKMVRDNVKKCIHSDFCTRAWKEYACPCNMFNDGRVSGLGELKKVGVQVLFRPSHKDGVMDALAGFNEGHRKPRRRQAGRSRPVQSREGSGDDKDRNDVKKKTPI